MEVAAVRLPTADEDAVPPSSTTFFFPRSDSAFGAVVATLDEVDGAALPLETAGFREEFTPSPRRAGDLEGPTPDLDTPSEGLLAAAEALAAAPFSDGRPRPSSDAEEPPPPLLPSSSGAGALHGMGKGSHPSAI